MIGFAGAGNMARALALGLGEPALFTDGGSGRAAPARRGGRGRGGRRPTPSSARADLLVLAHKPAQLEAVAREVGAAPLVLSLLGGVTVARAAVGLPGARVVRAMPNTAVEVRRGVTCVCGAEVRGGRGAARAASAPSCGSPSG